MIVADLDVTVVIEQLAIAGPNLLDDISAKLGERTFRVLVAGEFNAGKSFFINTMLDAWIREIDQASGKIRWNGLLGVDIVPATTLLTELRFGKFSAAKVNLRDGRSIPLSVADVPAFTDLARFGRGSTAHIRNADVFESLALRLNVSLDDLSKAGATASSTISEWLYEIFDRAVVELNSQLLKDGVVLVDSPGLGAVFHEHEKITEGEMRRADAIVFLIASTNPLTERAVKFLQTSRAFVENFFFVQTKVDQLAPADIERVRNRNCRILSEVLGLPEEQLRYRLISASRYRSEHAAGQHEGMVASGFPSLTADLADFLVKRRGTPTLQREISVVTRILEQAERHCINAQNFGRATATALDEQALNANEERVKLEIIAQKASTVIQDALTVALHDIQGRLVTLHDLFGVYVETMRGTGGIRLLMRLGSTSIDIELATALRGAAYQFAEVTIHEDIVVAAKRALSEIRALGFDELPMLIPLRFTLPSAEMKTHFSEKVQNQHIARYSELAESYFRTVGSVVEAQVSTYFKDLDRLVRDRFATKSAEFAQREAVIMRIRQSKGEALKAEQERLSALAVQLLQVRNSLAELQIDIDAA